MSRCRFRSRSLRKARQLEISGRPRTARRSEDGAVSFWPVPPGSRFVDWSERPPRGEAVDANLRGISHQTGPRLARTQVRPLFESHRPGPGPRGGPFEVGPTGVNFPMHTACRSLRFRSGFARGSVGQLAPPGARERGKAGYPTDRCSAESVETRRAPSIRSPVRCGRRPASRSTG